MREVTNRDPTDAMPGATLIFFSETPSRYSPLTARSAYGYEPGYYAQYRVAVPIKGSGINGHQEMWCEYPPYNGQRAKGNSRKEQRGDTREKCDSEEK